MTKRRTVAIDHTHEPATPQYAGFMGNDDKIKLEKAMFLDGSNSYIVQLTFSNGSVLNIDQDRQIANIAFPDGTTVNIPSELWYSQGKATESIAEGDNVMLAGSQGDHYLVKKAVALELATEPWLYLGVATKASAINEWVKITKWGLVNNINTNGWAYGTKLYYDPVTNGFTPTIPSLPEARIKVGMVVKTGIANGILLVDIADITLYTNAEIDALLSNYLPLTGGTLSGTLQINSTNSGDILLRLATDRPWSFKQDGDDGLTNLVLQPESDVKTFIIKSFDGTKSIQLRPYNAGAEIRVDGNKVWHAGNDGSGSTLDADLLDGKDSTAFQDALVSGTNIKTINGNSLLGSGDLSITATVDWSQVFDDSATYRQYKAKGGTSTGYMRTPSNGLIPESNGVGGVGTSTWRFASVYANAMYLGSSLFEVLGIAGEETTDPRTLKLTDGTIFKYGTITTATLTCSTAVGSLYRMASDLTLTFDTSFPFTVEPTVIIVLKYASGYMWAVLRSASTTNFTYNILSAVSVTSGVPWQLRYFAIGR